MKKLLQIFLIFLSTIVAIYLVAFSVRKLYVVEGPARMSTEHFKINYQGIYRGEAEEVGKALEANYDRINSELGNSEPENIEVYIHPDQQSFNQSTGLANSSANGTSRGPREFHFVWTNWFNSIFPEEPIKTALHEFAHCVQLNILIKKSVENTDTGNKVESLFNEAFERKFGEEYPQWFWEAVSTYEAEEIDPASVKYAMRNKPALESLNHNNRMNPLGYTMIEYIVQTWGKYKLPKLIATWGNVEEVLEVSKDEFQKGWHTFVEEKYL